MTTNSQVRGGMRSAPLASPQKNGTCACGGKYEPRTDGHGGLVDRCARCGAKPGDGRAVATFSSGSVKACTAKGCPGVLDAGGRCACCEKRAAWAAAHTPKRECEICNGSITGRGGRKYCEACKSVAQRAQIAGYKGVKAKRG